MAATDPTTALAEALAVVDVSGGPAAAAVLKALHDAGWAVRRIEPVVNPVILEGTTSAGIHVRLERAEATLGWIATIDGVQVEVATHQAYRDGGTQRWELADGSVIRMYSRLRAGGMPTYNGDGIR